MPELIDRQALIKDMCNNKTEAKCPCYPNCYPCDFSEARRIIDIQPTIEPERKKGHINICNWHECCSECGKCLGIGYTNYCGYCGAELEVT